MVSYTDTRVPHATLFAILLMQAAGVPAGWDLKPQVEKIGTDVARLRPLLERLQPATWTAAGASAAYEKQWKDCLDGIAYVQNAAARLSAKPDQLSIATETLVRLETLLEQASSLSQAVRRYQNPAVAEVIESEINAAGASRPWLRQHVMDLSVQREKELVVAESEAQRCRVQMTRPGARP